jgi:hypothetical protein
VGDTSVWGRADDGAVVHVDLAGHGAATDLAPWWPPVGLQRIDPPAVGVTPDASFGVTADMPATWDRLESDVGLFVAERLASQVAVHAAVIRADDVVMVLPGPSYAGKSTLCAAALDAGYQVLSDEYALVDPDTGLVCGWPRRLRVRTPRGDAHRMGDAVRHEPVAVDLVAEITYDPGVDVLDVAPMSAGETTLALLGNTVCASSRPEFAFSAMVVLGRSVSAVGGRRGEAAAALSALVELARSHPRVS